jgi:CheY-like chemotaxis protein
MVPNRQPPAEAAAHAYLLRRPIKYPDLRTVLGNAARRKPTAAQPQSPVPAPADGPYPLRILLVEDNRINQRVTLRMLKQMGFAADVAANGQEALVHIGSQPYDLVLMDIQMPIMDGIDATKAIRRLTTKIPQPYIVALTASAIKGDREQFLAAGMDDYLAKPVHLKHLRALLNRVPHLAQASGV